MRGARLGCQNLFAASPWKIYGGQASLRHPYHASIRSFISQQRMAQAPYADWSRDDLVNRVTELEQRLRHQNEQLEQKVNGTSAPPRKSPKKVRRPFDPTQYSTRFIALKIAYLGQRYSGFEHHEKTSLSTIEDELWKALVKTKLIFKNQTDDFNWDDCEYSKAGRTDKGVSAFGNVIGIRVRSARPLSASKADMVQDEERVQKQFDDIQDELPYPRLLNRVLPSDIRIVAWCPSLPSDFSARFSCRQRRYRYFFTQPAYCPVPGPEGINMRRNGQVFRDGMLDLESMRAAANKFVGWHDFRNFCKQDPARQITNFERNVEKAEITEITSHGLGLASIAHPYYHSATTDQIDRVYSFDVWGSAFLWHQVRHMVAILFLVGQGLEKPEIVDELLNIQRTPQKPVYDMASDQPLVLWDCIFPDLSINKPTAVDNLEWVFPDTQHTRMVDGKPGFHGTGNGRFGHHGIHEVLWADWHRKKIDELLAGHLFDCVGKQILLDTREDATEVRELNTAVSHNKRQTGRFFDGSGSLQHGGEYVPIEKRPRSDAPELSNARWLKKRQLPRMDMDD